MEQVVKITDSLIAKSYREAPYNALAKVLSSRYDGGLGHEGEAFLNDQEKAFLLHPKNISYVAASTKDAQLFFSTVLASDTSYAFYHHQVEEAQTRLKPVSSQHVVNFLKDLLGLRDLQASETSLTLNALGLLTLATLIDLVHRNHLEQKLLHLVADDVLTVGDLEEIFELSYQSGDLRWYLPFVVEAFGPFDKIIAKDTLDFKNGLKALEAMGLVKCDKQVVHITERGSGFIQKLLEARSTLSMISLFFDHGHLQYMPLAFISLKEVLYLLMPMDGADEFCFKSIDHRKFETLIEMVLAPGEEPPMASLEKKKPHKVQKIQTETPDTVQGPGRKFCKHCGIAISAHAKFCKACGKSLEKTNG